MPDNKVALFIDFDNIRIGIRQHFGGELHPQKLMNKASKYGRVTTAKAYADFTGHPKEFQDRLLFAAGIEPIHAPSKISGGRRQSSADMHMVIDMFLEAIDHPDVDTFVLMTGDADFVRMVATLRRRFGRKVIVSGVQSTSTSLDLMNAADARDPITKQDCDMTGELGRMTRPLVTRADLDAQMAAEEEAAAQPKGFLRGLFGRKPAGPAPVAVREAPAPVAPPAPRRMRASELRPAPASRSRETTAAEPRRASTRGTQKELPAVGADTRPDELEQRLVKEIFMMPPGRMGYTTMKTIEEVLRSKAGEMGSTRKEVPIRLQRLVEMGILKRVARNRGSGQVDTGELAFDNPIVASLTSGMRRPEPPPREERAPRSRARGSAIADSSDEEAATEETEAVAEVAAAETETAAPDEVEVVAEVEEPAPPPAAEPHYTFRWVEGVADATPEVPDAEASVPVGGEEPAKEAKTTAKRATRKPAAKRATTTRSRSKATKEPEEEPVAAEVAEAGSDTGL